MSKESSGFIWFPALERVFFQLRRQKNQVVQGGTVISGMLRERKKLRITNMKLNFLFPESRKQASKILFLINGGTEN